MVGIVEKCQPMVLQVPTSFSMIDPQIPVPKARQSMGEEEELIEGAKREVSKSHGSTHEQIERIEKKS
jgi:hypothetical protein